MKLLISVAYYSPHISGLTNSVKNLAEALATQGYRVQILTTQHKKNLPLDETIHKVPIQRVPYLFTLHKGFFMPQLVFSAYSAIQKSDQVLVVLPQVEGFVIAAIAKLLHKKVHVLYACEVQLTGSLLASVIAYLLRFANRLALCLADTIVTLTEDFFPHIPSSLRATEKVLAIYPVIKPPQRDEEARRQLAKKFPPRKYVIGFIGRIAAEKGIEYLLEAIPLLQKKLTNDFLIVLAGPQAIGEKQYREKINSLLKKYHESVVMLGELRDHELGAFYSLMDILVLPSVNSTEAFGMVQVEAMLCGTPVVASDLPGVRVPVRVTGMGALITPKDPNDLAEKIIHVLQNKKRYHKEKEKIENIFSPDHILAQYKKVFNE